MNVFYMAPDRGMKTMANSSLVQTLESSTGSAPIPPESITDSVPPPHLSHDPTNNAKRSDPFQFGQRYLEKQEDVFDYNAWDHVKPDEEHEIYSASQYAMQRAAPVSEFDRNRFNSQPEKWWDIFYKQKTSTFFKDRKWLVQEFPVLSELTKKDAGKKVILEVGAGAGNTAFPLLRMNENEEISIVAVDFSKNAVETMRNAEDYQNSKGHMRAEVWDAAGEALPEGIEAGSVDVVIMIFIFSALSPKQWAQAIQNVWEVLKPGGEVLFRDYGRGDLAQVRFKAGRWMEENFYVRGDGTRVYFFAKEELQQIWSGSYFESEQMTNRPPRFEIANLDVDRRLIVNRQRKLKMYRCWMQGRFIKPGR
jgi:tRNAThr (cytosine32-N3)-methyltransferase